MTTPDIAAVDAILAAGRTRPGALLPILHDIQDALGYVPDDAIPAIARSLDLSRAEVHGVVTFYPHFRRTPPGRRVVRVCQAEACQAMGAGALTEHLARALGVDLHGTTADGAYTLEPVYCLGNCACAPALMIDDDLHGRVTPGSADALLSGRLP